MKEGGKESSKKMTRKRSGMKISLIVRGKAEETRSGDIRGEKVKVKKVRKEIFMQEVRKGIK